MSAHHNIKLKTKNHLVRGFTLIELLVVIGILAVLLAITLIAINPAKQFSQANNTKRRSDVNAILNAIQQYAAEHKGTLPATFSTSSSSPSLVKKAGTGHVDLCDVLTTEYIAQLPVDPKSPVQVTDCNDATFDSGYTVFQSANDSRITVNAPLAELQEVITVTR